MRLCFWLRLFFCLLRLFRLLRLNFRSHKRRNVLPVFNLACRIFPFLSYLGKFLSTLIEAKRLWRFLCGFFCCLLSSRKPVADE